MNDSVPQRFMSSTTKVVSAYYKCFIKTSHSSLDSQGPHAGQAPEGSVCQLADVVPLELQHLQTGETLEGQALNQTQPVPA